ncbi:MAG: hypothetical protein V3T24_02605, partial [Longimicrobiales bacterium]
VGLINVIVKPDIYERDRMAVRMEPFITVRGRLQKDGLTMNVLAHEVRALKAGQSVPNDEFQRGSPFRYLTALRQSPPGIKNFG